MTTIKAALFDCRSEWAFRWTALLAICYAMFFFPPENRIASWIDWSLPVQLASGGNVAFYNAGFHAFFGVGSAFAMVVAGCLLSLILPLLRQDELVGAYFILMVMLSVMTLPVIAHIGVLNNLSSIAVLLVVIFTEVFYGPILNLRSVLPDARSIFTEVVRGNAVPAIIYVGFSWAVYLVPPWHSGMNQALALVSSVLAGVEKVLLAAVDSLDKLGGDKSTQQECQSELRNLARGLFQETNSSGLETPIALYGDMGLYEVTLLYPFTSVGGTRPKNLAHRLDQVSFRVAIALWTLGSPDLLSTVAIDGALREQLISYLRASAQLAHAASAVTQCTRRNWSFTKASDWREGISTNLHLFGSTGRASTTLNAKTQIAQALKTCEESARVLQEYTDTEESIDEGSLVWATVRDLSCGGTRSSGLDLEKDSKGEGSLSQILTDAVALQASFGDSTGFIRELFRLSFMEQVWTLLRSWIKGVVDVYQSVRVLRSPVASHYQTPILRRRHVRRAIQFVVGTWGLYAMATWWDAYATLLGSSSTGQWTMVAFYVCFRATCEETVNASILRSIGHGLGALLSWGINTAVTTSGGRMAVHLIIHLVLMWFIPPPFVYPSSISLITDNWLGNSGMLEGLLTTYHLTSVLVFSTDIESAAKARALSQCIGALAAAVVSLLIFPWYARVECKKTLHRFLCHSKTIVQSLDPNQSAPELLASTHSSVMELLQARRDWSGAIEAKGWFYSLLDLLNLGLTDDVSEKLLEDLSRAAIGGFALESLLRHIQALSTKDAVGAKLANELKRIFKDYPSTDKYSETFDYIRKMMSTLDTSDVNLAVKDELSTVYVILLVLRESEILAVDSAS